MATPDNPGKLVNFQKLDAETQDLIKQAGHARESAYVPYSKFKVGCALLTRNGDIFTGCNVENASYGISICAERTAIVKAVSSGSLDIVKIAVVAEMGNKIVAPCGACRQFIFEFSTKTDILVYCSDVQSKNILEAHISELLPWGFRLEQ